MQTAIEATGEEPNTSLSRVLRAASLIVSSPEPAVVFDSLVQLGAPLVCAAATATVSESDGSIHASKLARVRRQRQVAAKEHGHRVRRPGIG